MTQWLAGKIIPGRELGNVKSNLAKLFKKDIHQIEQLFAAKKSIVLKKGLGFHKANQLQVALIQQTGAIFDVIAQKSDTSIGPAPSESQISETQLTSSYEAVTSSKQRSQEFPLDDSGEALSLKPIASRKSVGRKVTINQASLPTFKKIAIFWDIENVNPSSSSLFVDGLLSYANELGKVTYSLAVGDWQCNIHENIPFYLSESGFELVYIPHAPEKNLRKKNSADIILITKATEMIFQLPHITTYVIITGDIDFRPLLQILKKHGKEVIVICDSNNASERLLEFADNYADYRDLLPNDDSEDEELVPEDEGMHPEYDDNASGQLSIQEAFQLLRESVIDMNKQKKIPTPGSVKVRMKLLNENFTGDVEGFTKWQEFITAAVKKKVIEREKTNNKIILKVPDSQHTMNATPEIFQHLTKGLNELANGKKLWVDFSKINNNMIERGIKVKEHKYSQFKQFILDAEKRGLVETQCQGMKWFARLKS